MGMPSMPLFDSSSCVSKEFNLTPDTFDLGKEAKSIMHEYCKKTGGLPYAPEYLAKLIIKFGHACMNEAFERAADICYKSVKIGSHPSVDSRWLECGKTPYELRDDILRLKSPPPVLKDSKNER